MRINSDMCLGFIVGALVVIGLGTITQAVQQQNEYSDAEYLCLKKLASEGVERSEITTFKGKCYLGAG